jgi:hypothetical protein
MNEIKAAQEELNRTFSEAGQSFYAQSQGAASAADAAGAPAGEAGPGGPTSTGPANAGPNEDVVEADYEIVDENKK